MNSEGVEYRLRVYVFNGEEKTVGNYLNGLIDGGVVELLNTVLGVGGLVCFYDMHCDGEVVRSLCDRGLRFFPIGHYEAFDIRSGDGELIEDAMILLDYSDEVRMGKNIVKDGVYETAEVLYKN